MSIVLSENFRALFYAPFYAAHATGAFREAGVEVELRREPGLIHNFLMLDEVSPASAAAADHVAAELHDRLNR